MAKLNFALDLVECILEVAKCRGAALNTFSESVAVNKGEQLSDQVPTLFRIYVSLPQQIKRENSHARK